MNKKRFLSGIGLTLAVVTGLCSCGGGKNDVATGDGILYIKNGLETVRNEGAGLKFYSSDSGFDDFLNDYYSRHIRDNTSKSIGVVKQGTGRMYQKDPEAKFISFYNSTSENVNGYDPSYNLSSELDSYYVTQYGSVMDECYVRNQTGTYTNGGGGLGWPFVYCSQTGNYSAEFNDEDTQGWTMNGSTAGAVSGGYWTIDFQGAVNQSMVYESPEIFWLAKDAEEEEHALLKYAPLIEIAFGIKNKDGGGLYPNIKDIVVSWQIENDDEWYSMSYYTDAMYNREITGNDYMAAWFPAYLHPSWGADKKLTNLKVEIIPDDGKKLNATVDFNYIRLQTDTRLTNNNAWYINAMEEWISFTGDFDMLERHLDDLRKAAMFEIYALGGKDGLIKTDYVWGKTTTYVPMYYYGLQGNGWYDCMPTGTINLQSNIEFYNSLEAMARIEELAAAKGITSESKIRNPHPYADGAEDIAWSYTPETLIKLAEEIKQNVRKDYDKGGLWNPKTGRFAWAIYDENSDDLDEDGNIREGGLKGEPMDYGHTEFNLYAVALGIASDEQAKSIMSWIDGERTVAGDDSTGEDIYMYEFAPRVNTRSNEKDHVSIHVNDDFGKDIQNGGASMHVAYYDLLARKAYGGNDYSFKRFKGIQTWYEKVKAAGGEGMAFYNVYYGEMMAEGGRKWKLSGNGSVGAVGLDYEFYESALLYATVPSLYFGLDSVKYNQLTVAPDLPADLSYMAMTNLRFYGAKYDLYVRDNKVVISGVRGGDGTAKANVTLKDKSNAKVYVNGKETTDFKRENGKINVVVDFGNCVIEVK